MAHDANRTMDQNTFPALGSWEVMVGANGSSNRALDDSAGGIDFSVGRYFTPTTEWVVRQGISYTNPDYQDDQWFGSTRLALDQHFAAHGSFRPFVGANFGGIYGEAVRDSWAAGLEGGVKYYVHPSTFVQVMVEYAWLFEHGNAIDDRFHDGRWNWSVGVGFDF
ncbi:MAG TPA: hypothetical protein VHE13_16800 [Opitutus sp.]|nr:hypothetical protein [Opitutus sp.]